MPLDQPGVPSGHRACNRTVRVFDGWTRYDVQLSYKETKAIDGGADPYSGRIIVCAARYVPIAGHRSTRKAVQDMANNKRLEVWLAPVASMPVLVPFRILIGTDLGDLIIYATHFTSNWRNATRWRIDGGFPRVPRYPQAALHGVCAFDTR